MWTETEMMTRVSQYWKTPAEDPYCHAPLSNEALDVWSQMRLNKDNVKHT